MPDCWQCKHLEKRTGGFQYCLLSGGRRNIDANCDRCDDYQVITHPTNTEIAALLRVLELFIESAMRQFDRPGTLIHLATIHSRIRAMAEQLERQS